MTTTLPHLPEDPPDDSVTADAALPSGELTPADRRSVRRARVAIAVGCAIVGSVWLLPAAPALLNRPLADVPQVSAEGVLSGQYMGQLNSAIADRVPIKAPAMTLLSSAVVGAGLSTTGDVYRTPHGQPFYGLDFTRPCLVPVNADWIGALSDTGDAFADRGMYFLEAVVPNKSAIERDGIGPFADALLVCSDSARAALETGEDDGAPLLTGFEAFEAAEAAGDPVFQYADTHPNALGGEIFARLLLERLIADGEAPADLLRPTDEITTTSASRPENLYRLMGLERYQEVAFPSVHRDGVTLHTDDQSFGELFTTTYHSTATGDAPFIEGRTLVIFDSTFEYTAQVLAPYFEDLTMVSWFDLGGDHPEIAGEFDRVIVQRIQFNLPDDFTALRDAPWIQSPR